MWSKNLQTLTRETLENLPVSAFMRNNRVHMKCFSPDGQLRSGWVKLENAMQSKWLVEEENWQQQFSSIDELIEAGWAID